VTVNYVNPTADPATSPDAELMDLYVPGSVGPDTGLLLYLHGGGWAEGDRTELPAWVLHQVTRGYVVASLGYRLAYYDEQGVAHNTFPASVQDVKLGVRALKALGVWMGTSPRVIVAGASAGGHLASFAGATPGQFEPTVTDPALAPYDSTVVAAVNIVGPTDLEALATDPDTSVAAFYVAHLLGCPQPTMSSPYTCPPGTDFATASVVTHLDASDPPMYFGYGGIDNWVPADTQGAPAAAKLAEVTGYDWMAWYDLAEGVWHDLDGRHLHMTALHGFLDAARDGQFEALLASP
jgi:acetyl esterase/lipase